MKMESKVILITGSTDGIGKQTAFELAKKGHTIIVHGREKQKSQRTVKEIKSKIHGAIVESVSGDLSDFTQIKNFCNDIKEYYSKLDVLINNAGIFENNRVILPNGFEKTFMINYLSHFFITLQLLELLKETPNSRIVNVSSMAQSGSIDFDNLNGEKYYDPYNAYAVSKLENILFTYKLARLLKNKQPIVNCLHPGVIKTKLLIAGWGMGGANLPTGAQELVYSALSEDMNNKTGLYMVNQKPMRSATISYDKKIQDRLWDISLTLTGLSYT